MSKRYYLCDVEKVNTGEFDEIRPVVADYNVNWVGEVDLVNNRALVLVNTINHSSLITDPRIEVLPNFPLDGKINAMQGAARDSMRDAMLARGLSDSTTNADGYRDVIRGIGLQFNPNFNEDDFDVSE